MYISVTDIVLSVMYFIILYLSVFWLLVLLSKKEDVKKEMLDFPLVSVIIPAYNEELTITASIQSIFALKYPNIELIVVNDGSKDNTQAIAQKLQETSKIPFKIISQENKGKGAALNQALKIAQGEFYATLDADSSVDPQILHNLMPYFTSGNIGAVLPLLKIKDPKNILQRIQRYEYIINMFYKMLNSKLDCVHVTPGPFSVYRTSIIRPLGGYDENNITEDLEIAIRLQKHHYRIIQTGEPAVYTIPPATIRGLYRQRNRWYKGSILNSIKYRNIMFNRKYGDFGFMRLPTIIISGVLSIIVLSTLTYDTLSTIIEKMINLYSINFDILTLFRNWVFDFHVFDLNFLKITVAFFVLALGLGVMIASFRYSQEKITKYGKTFFSLAYYMLLYSFILSVVWFMIGIEIARGKVQRW